MASTFMSLILKPMLESQTTSSGQSLTDLIQGVKKSPGVSPKTLKLPSLQGNGILVADSVIVSSDSSGDFQTIQNAIDSAPNNLTTKTDGYFVIYAKSGIYNEEHMNIPSEKTSLLLLGDGMDNTVITGNKSVASSHVETHDTATFRKSGIFGAGFVAMNVRFENTSKQGSQAVAVNNESDQSAFYKCSFLGHQDTLYAHSGKQFYRECDISGTVDFIFGDAAAVFQKCRILARHPEKSTVVITAQNRSLRDGPTGTVFQGCSVMAGEPGVEKNSVYLGRPWADCARVVYMESEMSEIVNELGYMPWPNAPKKRDETVSYREFGITGLGAATKSKPRVAWKGIKVTFNEDLSDAPEAKSFTVRAFLAGQDWIPATNIPFDLDLYH